MNNLPSHPSEYSANQSSSDNVLWQYVQSLNPETVAQLSKPEPEVAQIMEQNLRGMLGHLPPEHFAMTITTSRENLGQMLASAMMSGYFLHQAKQRMELDTSLQDLHSS
ncbi:MULTISPECIES: DUF760 domain-containing protein [Okeania]|uniref:DUF760 domain-containing protein n=1 Tax=Okeania hirsuta TaxID=1458930 RepID=A0A3N6RFM3_9CYAN|nr:MULTISPECIES: DUF760 domain-containing protein [Okeania]NEP05149.1 DUF760 domain-containing protein [Okeania sp. SIO4D6]NEP39862.1 DUF760 domain-containing protein [Okeania sp. SIO2H7]NET16822.1 DUF760 domain-containing protein [Okeania sp. SIO1H6]NEP71986.1 DUF760 domain-containing protein [Okeania sp. SIO2G5]NEP89564.1 DUF760 domain-containing protein [Okeania sp. SIO2C2]